RDMISDGKRIGEIRDYIADGRDQYGMQTFDQHLADLVQDGTVTFDTAMAAATNPSDFALKMRMFNRDGAQGPKLTGEMEAVPRPGAAHLAVLARAPRAAGSAAEDEAREYCARVLRDAGFDVALEPFEYSQVPGRYGTPVGGAIAWSTVAATSWLGAIGSPAF